MILLSLFLACAPDVAPPKLITVTPECPQDARLTLDRLGEPVSVELCQWDDLGWWCDGAVYSLGRDYLVVDCEEGGELRVGWWVGGEE